VPNSLANRETADALLRALSSRLATLITPALVFDFDAIEHNIAVTSTFCGASRWRPHVKTHKHPDVVRALLRAGVTALKCATLDELSMVLGAAETTPVDVLIAYPLQPAGALAAARLAAAHPNAEVRLLADSPAHLRQLDIATKAAARRLSVLLDVDVGMHRTGSAPERWRDAAPVADNLDLVGLHGYEGHLSWDEDTAAADGYAALAELAARVPFDVRWVVTSGTHAFHHALDSEVLRNGPWTHQVSPGTLVLSDLRSEPAAQLLGLRQAAFVLSRVISTPTDQRVTLDAGSKAVNPDCPPPGCAVMGYPDVCPTSASEEHRPCDAPTGTLSYGDMVVLIPEHVCTTVNLYRSALCIRDGRDRGAQALIASSRSHDTEAFAPV
jgi:D-serine deaminase-like pyridoxal phosphate-dependent protein